MMILHRYQWSLIAVHDISLVCITHNLNITKGPEGISKWRSWQIQHRQNRCAKSVSSKEAIGIRQIELYSCRLCYTWHVRTTCNAISCNAIVDMGRCCFKFIGCKVLSVAHILLWLLPPQCARLGNVIIENKVIKFWNALTCSLYNLYRNYSFTAGKTGLLAFECHHLCEIWRKNWANTNQMKIVGRNRILPPLSIIKAAKKRKPLIIYLPRKTIEVAKLKFVNWFCNLIPYWDLVSTDFQLAPNSEKTGDRQFLSHSYLLNFSSNFTTTMAIKS